MSVTVGPDMWLRAALTMLLLAAPAAAKGKRTDNPGRQRVAQPGIKRTPGAGSGSHRPRLRSKRAATPTAVHGQARIANAERRRPRWIPVGWADASPDGWNASEAMLNGVRRIPIDGLRTINQSTDQQPRLERANGRAVVLIPRDLDPDEPVDVLIHLHGYNSGYRQERTATRNDPVRDRDIEHLEDQLRDSGRRQVMLVLPQGVGASSFAPNPSNSELKGFDAQALAGEVVDRLLGAGVLRAQPAFLRLNLSAHSGGGDALGQMLVAERGPGDALGLVALFDAVNGPKEELPRLEGWLERRLVADLASLHGLDTLAQQRYLETSLRFRAYHTPGGYYGPLHDEPRPVPGALAVAPPDGPRPRPLKQFLDDWFQEHEEALGGADGPAYRGLRDNYQVIQAPNALHETLLGAGLLKDALLALPTFADASGEG